MADGKNVHLYSLSSDKVLATHAGRLLSEESLP